jgi:competence protein ComEC
MRIEALRDILAERIAQAADGDSRAVLMALLLGERRQIPDELREAFNRAGVSHILAISGLHVGIAASAAFFMFKWLLSFATPLLFLGWARKGAALLAIGPVIFYGILAGMSPSTQRAVIMTTIFLLTFLLEKDHDLFNTLAAAGLIILLFHPPALFSVSFQLSFAAVLSILYGVEKTAGCQQRIATRMPSPLKPVAGFIWVTCLAIIGTAPLVMYYFNQLPVFGVLSNLIIVPLVGFVSVPAGLFSIGALNPISADAAVLGLRLSAWFVDLSLEIIDLIARCPFSAIKTVTPSLLEIICYYVLLWCLFNFRDAGKQSDASEKQGPHQQSGTATGTGRQAIPGAGLLPKIRQITAKVKPVYLILAAVIIIAAADATYWVHKRFYDDSLRVTILDVGQGSAALLELPRGHCVLIDGGGFSDNTVFDMGRWVLAPYLWHGKIRTIDTVILSHPDADHLNGLIYILRYFRVGRIISTHEPSGHAEYAQFIELIRKNRILHPDFCDLPRSFSINGVTFDILYPPTNFRDPHAGRPWQNPNNNSLVIRITHGNHAILFPGDIMADAEKELIGMHPDGLGAAVLIAPHHGSRTSSTDAFLDAVNPMAVIISSGRPATFPASDVLKRYEDRNLRILRTDTHGAVRITSDGRNLTCMPLIATD